MSMDPCVVQLSRKYQRWIWVDSYGSMCSATLNLESFYIQGFRSHLRGYSIPVKKYHYFKTLKSWVQHQIMKEDLNKRTTEVKRWTNFQHSMMKTC